MSRNQNNGKEGTFWVPLSQNIGQDFTVAEQLQFSSVAWSCQSLCMRNMRLDLQSILKWGYSKETFACENGALCLELQSQYQNQILHLPSITSTHSLLSQNSIKLDWCERVMSSQSPQDWGSAGWGAPGVSTSLRHLTCAQWGCLIQTLASSLVLPCLCNLCALLPDVI